MDTLKAYLSNPEEYFGHDHRQARKLNKTLRRLGKQLSLSKAELIDLIVNAATLRTRYAGSTIYIKNIGSSGSHWLNTMLTQGIGALSGGEVYIAPKFCDSVLSGLDDLDAKIAVHAIMLAHAFIDAPSVITASLVNSAHVAKLSRFTAYDSNAYKIFLIRDPVDIVVSRTFRKPEFREYQGYAEIPDEEYADINIRRVEKFMRSAMREHHDLVCKYEELDTSAFDILSQIARDTGAEAPEKKIQQAITSTSSESGDDAFLKRSKLNRDENPIISSDLISNIRWRLESLRKDMGYV